MEITIIFSKILGGYVLNDSIQRHPNHAPGGDVSVSKLVFRDEGRQ